VLPARPELDGSRCRPDEVGEENGRQHPVRASAARRVIPRLGR
jgi:hypothetical protein